VLHSNFPFADLHWQSWVQAVGEKWQVDFPQADVNWCCACPGSTLGLCWWVVCRLSASFGSRTSQSPVQFDPQSSAFCKEIKGGVKK
jgi:hypothetical protein